MNNIEIVFKGLSAKQLTGLISFLADKENRLQSLEVGRLFAKDEFSNVSEMIVADIIKLKGNVQSGFDVVVKVLESVPYVDHVGQNQNEKNSGKATIDIEFIEELFRSVEMFSDHKKKK